MYCAQMAESTRQKYVATAIWNGSCCVSKQPTLCGAVSAAGRYVAFRCSQVRHVSRHPLRQEDGAESIH